MTTATYTVVGMTCEHCVNAVRSEVEAIEGVTGVDVDLTSARVVVESDRPVSDEAFAAAVDEAGYEVATG